VGKFGFGLAPLPYTIYIVTSLKCLIVFIKIFLFFSINLKAVKSLAVAGLLD